MDEQHTHTPDTCPQPVRLLPPSVPPAPPGGSPPPFGSGASPDPNAPDLLDRLSEGLRELAVIGTTFETIDVFPDDVELRSELGRIVNDARQVLARRLQGIIAWITDNQERAGADLQDLRAAVVRLAEEREDAGKLASLMHTAPYFGPDKHHRFAEGSYKAGEWVSSSDLDFLARVLKLLSDRVESDEYFTDGQEFERGVRREYIGLCFCVAASCATGPEKP